MKNIWDTKIGRDTRAFGGISLSPPFQSRDKSPANTGGVKDIETENPKLQNLSGDTPHGEGFPKNEEVQSPVSEEVSRPPSEDDYLSGPETFEEDGLTFEYMPERSE